MYSKLHQMLIGLIARKMQDEGYEVVAFDGKEYLFEGQCLCIPPRIIRHRPDIIGYKFETKEICIGEAKTRNDLFSKRTKEQLMDYSSIKGTSTGKNIRIVLGIPESAQGCLIQLLQKLNLSGKDFVSYVWLPEELAEK